MEKKGVSPCYEAEPAGFVLACRLRSLGFECEVVAPSMTPKADGDQAKTDPCSGSVGARPPHLSEPEEDQREEKACPC